jgi:FtsZ-binding cell division protein ZapB
VRFGANRIGLPAKEKGRVTMVDTLPAVKTESDLQVELERLKARLAQGQRDHQRSHDDLQTLEGEIRQIKRELRTLIGNTATTMTGP